MSNSIQQQIGSIALLVEEYDEALEFYTQKLSFTLIEDVDLGDGVRWVQVSPANSIGTNLVLTKANTEQQKHSIGKQAGGSVFLILHTNDFWRDYNTMLSNGVAFEEEPRNEPYGTVAIFQDLYGNRWDLIERRNIQY